MGKEDSKLLSTAQNRFNGNDLRDMFKASMVLMERNLDAINSLNVFPVPDGDTGTNMFLTLQSVMDAAGDQSIVQSGNVASQMARGALMGARGNSGVILSQFFKGFAVGFEDTVDFGSEELVEAFNQACDYAYKAVSDPVEGTMLTVIRDVAEASQNSLSNGDTIQTISDGACIAASESVKKTPSLLPVLREAGVVDAGGQGISVILEGIRCVIKGQSVDDIDLLVPRSPNQTDSTSVSTDFLDAIEGELYGYCTQLLIEGSQLKVDEIRNQIDSLASSTVVVGDESMIKVHVHTDDPGPAISFAVSKGVLKEVNIQNMDDQHVEYSAARRSEEQIVPIALVAIAWGAGIENLFYSLGASRILTGGNTMNPSVQDILKEVENAPSENIIILPNNRNIVPAAMQVPGNSTKNVKVVNSKSIPQGVAAILNFNPEDDLESNISAMEEVISSVKTAEVTEAVRATVIKNGEDVEDVNVDPGQLIGLLDQKLVVAGDNILDVVSSLLNEASVSEGDLVTLYWGDCISKEDASFTKLKLEERFNNIEIELIDGGQPHYHFIISIE